MKEIKLPIIVSIAIIFLLCIASVFILDYLFEAIRQPNTLLNILGLLGVLQLIIFDYLTINFIISKTEKK